MISYSSLPLRSRMRVVSNWDAFWRSSVLEQPIDAVAAELGISPGAVYIARSRVLHRLKQLLLQWEINDAE